MALKTKGPVKGVHLWATYCMMYYTYLVFLYSKALFDISFLSIVKLKEIA